MSVLKKRDALEPRGAVLRPDAAQRAFDIRRIPPSEALAPFVTHYWFIRWDLERPFTQSVLSRPAANLVSEPEHWMVSGVWTARFDWVLAGRGDVFGVLFRPAGFAAFFDAPLHTIVDRRVDFCPDEDPVTLHRALLRDPDDAARVARLEGLLAAREPSAYDGMEALNDIVELAERASGITRAEQLAERAGIGLRVLQRRLRQHVGVGPKALLRRFRLQEAAARLAESKRVDHAALAQALGYCDQAHFVRDFTAVVGQPPGKYAASLG